MDDIVSCADIVTGLQDFTLFETERVELVIVGMGHSYGIFIPIDYVLRHPAARRSGNAVKAILDEVAKVYWEVVSGFYDDVAGHDPLLPLAAPFSRSLDVHGEVLGIDNMSVYIEHGQRRGKKAHMSGEFIFLCDRALTVENFFPHRVKQDNLH